ncbi:hypothetical protein BCR42DRAFT_422084 [Absidia repens]|uniref:Uncharacterized protein n=1 Tax=Absidia repens TaxID=90262 RepID=A0A1X2I775_9FUNG|nr:hypothetical protein BCR42DRAFT_422084 [Absidia repens]
MASLLWTKNQNSKLNNRAPSSIFSNNSNLSPRQIATKACNLAIKKLDRDDKRSRPQYNVRERLLLCNTLSNAEKFLQKRTHRTNRRVMAFEEDDMTSPSEDIVISTQLPEPIVDLQASANGLQYTESHSPLCHIDEMNEDDEDDDDKVDEYVCDNQVTTIHSQQQQQHQEQQAQFMTLDMALQSNSLASMGNNAFVIPQDDEDFLQYPSSFLIPTTNSNVLSSDCRLLRQQNTHSSPITSII